jgi:hypothetical protein
MEEECEVKTENKKGFTKSSNETTRTAAQTFESERFKTHNI